MILRNSSSLCVSLMVLLLVNIGCATKKHVREAIAPVQNEVDEVKKQTTENKVAIGDLDRQVAIADEKATDAAKKAAEATEAAARANAAAAEAAKRAEAANSAAL